MVPIENGRKRCGKKGSCDPECLIKFNSVRIISSYGAHRIPTNAMLSACQRIGWRHLLLFWSKNPLSSMEKLAVIKSSDYSNLWLKREQMRFGYEKQQLNTTRFLHSFDAQITIECPKISVWMLSIISPALNRNHWIWASLDTESVELCTQSS